MTSRRPMVAMTSSAVLFGVSSTGTKFAQSGFGPVTVLAVELLSATAVLWILLLRRGYRRPAGWRRMVVLGLFEPGLAYLLFSFGLSETSAANGALLSGMESGFVVVLAALFLRERVGWSVIVAVCLAGLGLLVLDGSGTFSGPGRGDLLITAGALSAAAYTVIARGISTTDDSLTVTAHQFAVGTAAVVPLAATRCISGAESFPLAVAPQFWMVAVLVGVLGYASGFLLYNLAIVDIAAGPAGVIINLAPAFGLASAVLWLGETLTPARMVGATLIALSVVLFVAVERGRDLPPAESATTRALIR